MAISYGRHDLSVVEHCSPAHGTGVRHDADGSELDHDQVALHKHAVLRHIDEIGGEP